MEDEKRRSDLPRNKIAISKITKMIDEWNARADLVAVIHYAIIPSCRKWMKDDIPIYPLVQFPWNTLRWKTRNRRATYYVTKSPFRK